MDVRTGVGPSGPGGGGACSSVMTIGESMWLVGHEWPPVPLRLHGFLWEARAPVRA